MIRRVIKKFSRILSKHQKVRVIELFILMIIGGFLEMFSISLVIPFINMVTEGENLLNNKIASRVCGYLGIESSRQLMIVTAFALAFLYLFKNIFLLIQTHFQYRFVFNSRLATQRQLMHNYLHYPYEYYLSIKSGEVLRVVNSDTAQAYQLLSNLLLMFSEIIVSMFLVIALLIVSPLMTICMIVVLLVLSGVITYVLRPIMYRNGIKEQHSNYIMQSWLLQAIQGIKEVKVSKKEDYFERKYYNYSKTFLGALRKTTVLGLVPRLTIEGISISLFLMLVAILLYRGADFKILIPTITAMAMAAIRLMPSVNRVSTCLASIANEEPMLDKLLENQDLFKKADIPQKTAVLGKIDGFKEMINVSNISYKYPEGNGEVLSDASFVIKRGSSVGLVGVSGAGKTTVVDIILGLLVPQKGFVLSDSIDINDDKDGWLNNIGYIPQNIYILDDTIKANIAFGIEEELIDEEKVWSALEQASLKEFVEELPNNINTELGERGVRLSGGQRQRIGIARALYDNPSILVLDEATSALDNETEKAIMDSINKLHGKKTLIIIAHRLSTIEACDVVYRVEGGKIVIEKEKKYD